MLDSDEREVPDRWDEELDEVSHRGCYDRNFLLVLCTSPFSLVKPIFKMDASCILDAPHAGVKPLDQSKSISIQNDFLKPTFVKKQNSGKGMDLTLSKRITNRGKQDFDQWWIEKQKNISHMKVEELETPTITKKEEKTLDNLTAICKASSVDVLSSHAPPTTTSPTTSSTSYVKVWDGLHNVEVPTGKSGTLSVETLRSQFPSATPPIGLKYKTDEGTWRVIRLVDNQFQPPREGWGDQEYVVGRHANQDPVKSHARNTLEEPIETSASNSVNSSAAQPIITHVTTSAVNRITTSNKSSITSLASSSITPIASSAVKPMNISRPKPCTISTVKLVKHPTINLFENTASSHAEIPSVDLLIKNDQGVIEPETIEYNQSNDVRPVPVAISRIGTSHGYEQAKISKIGPTVVLQPTCSNEHFHYRARHDIYNPNKPYYCPHMNIVRPVVAYPQYQQNINMMMNVHMPLFPHVLQQQQQQQHLRQMAMLQQLRNSGGTNSPVVQQVMTQMVPKLNHPLSHVHNYQPFVQIPVQNIPSLAQTSINVNTDDKSHKSKLSSWTNGGLVVQPGKGVEELEECDDVQFDRKDLTKELVELIDDEAPSEVNTLHGLGDSNVTPLHIADKCSDEKSSREKRIEQLPPRLREKEQKKMIQEEKEKNKDVIKEENQYDSHTIIDNFKVNESLNKNELLAFEDVKNISCPSCSSLTVNMAIMCRRRMSASMRVGSSHMKRKSPPCWPCHPSTGNWKAHKDAIESKTIAREDFPEHLLFDDVVNNRRENPTPPPRGHNTSPSGRRTPPFRKSSPFNINLVSIPKELLDDPITIDKFHQESVQCLDPDKVRADTIESTSSEYCTADEMATEVYSDLNKDIQITENKQDNGEGIGELKFTSTIPVDNSIDEITDIVHTELEDVNVFVKLADDTTNAITDGNDCLSKELVSTVSTDEYYNAFNESQKELKDTQKVTQKYNAGSVVPSVTSIEEDKRNKDEKPILKQIHEGNDITVDAKQCLSSKLVASILSMDEIIERNNDTINGREQKVEDVPRITIASESVPLPVSVVPIVRSITECNQTVKAEEEKPSLKVTDERTNINVDVDDCFSNKLVASMLSADHLSEENNDKGIDVIEMSKEKTNPNIMNVNVDVNDSLSNKLAASMFSPIKPVIPQPVKQVIPEPVNEPVKPVMPQPVKQVTPPTDNKHILPQTINKPVIALPVKQVTPPTDDKHVLPQTVNKPVIALPVKQVTPPTVDKHVLPQPVKQVIPEPVNEPVKPVMPQPVKQVTPPTDNKHILPQTINKPVIALPVKQVTPPTDNKHVLPQTVNKPVIAQPVKQVTPPTVDKHVLPQSVKQVTPPTVDKHVLPQTVNKPVIAQPVKQVTPPTVDKHVLPQPVKQVTPPTVDKHVLPQTVNKPVISLPVKQVTPPTFDKHVLPQPVKQVTPPTVDKHVIPPPVKPVVSKPFKQVAPAEHVVKGNLKDKCNQDSNHVSIFKPEENIDNYIHLKEEKPTNPKPAKENKKTPRNKHDVELPYNHDITKHNHNTKGVYGNRVTHGNHGIDSLDAFDNDNELYRFAVANEPSKGTIKTKNEEERQSELKENNPPVKSKKKKKKKTDSESESTLNKCSTKESTNVNKEIYVENKGSSSEAMGYYTGSMGAYDESMCSQEEWQCVQKPRRRRVTEDSKMETKTSSERERRSSECVPQHQQQRQQQRRRTSECAQQEVCVEKGVRRGVEMRITPKERALAELQHSKKDDTKLPETNETWKEAFTRSFCGRNYVFYILRGLPGCGKSKVAAAIKGCYDGEEVSLCSARNVRFSYHGDGQYLQDHSELILSHTACQEEVRTQCGMGKNVIIIDDTHLRRDDFEFYLRLAHHNDYIVNIIEPNNHLDVNTCFHNNRNLVPMENLKFMRTVYEDVVAYYYGWCVSLLDTLDLRGSACHLIQSHSADIPAFRNFIYKQNVQKIENLFQVYHMKASSSCKNMLHVTSCYTNSGRRPGSRLYARSDAVMSSLGRAEELQIVGLCITPKSLFARVLLSEKQKRVWGNNDARNGEANPLHTFCGLDDEDASTEKECSSRKGRDSLFPPDQQNECVNKILNFIQDMDHNYLLPDFAIGCSAHITLGVVDGFSPVTARENLKLIIEHELSRKPSLQYTYASEMVRCYGDNLWVMYFRESIVIPAMFCGSYYAERLN